VEGGRKGGGAWRGGRPEGVGRLSGRAAGRGGEPCGAGGRKGWGAVRPGRPEGVGRLAGHVARCSIANRRL
jgi:hypothetical protein